MMRPLGCLLFALLLLAIGPSRAPAMPALTSVPATDELLGRWGLDPARYRGLGVEEKRRIRAELGRLEAGRLERLRLLEVAAAEACRARGGAAADCFRAWEAHVTPTGHVDAAGERLLAQRAAALAATPLPVPAALEVERLDGEPLTAQDLGRARQALDRMFDGLERLRQLPAKLPFRLEWDAHFRNGTLYSLTTTHPESGISVEVGQLGVDGRSALLGKSWYGNLLKRWESGPESRVDYRIHTQIGYVDLQARFFDDDGDDDPRVERALGLMQSLGLAERRSEDVRSYLDYDDAYQTHGMIVSSLLAELGRAHHLFGPVDFAWTIGNLSRIVHLDPNTAFDETLGFRVRLGEGLYLGVFGGMTQNLSPLHSQVVGDLVRREGLGLGLEFETAPHATVALWGGIPSLSDLRFQVSGGSRWNDDTTVHRGEIALFASFFDRPLGLRGSYSMETGAGIEFDRKRLRAELDYQVRPGTRLYVAHERERIGFGSARVESNATLAGAEIGFGRSGSTLTMDQLFGGSYDEVSRLSTEVPSMVQRVSGTVGEGVEIAAKARELARRMRDAEVTDAELEPAFDALGAALQRMPLELAFELARVLGDLDLTALQAGQLRALFLPADGAGDRADRLRAFLARSLGPASSWADEVESAAAYLDGHEPEIRELVTLLGSPGVWQAVLVRAGRATVLEGLRNTNVRVPLGFGDLSVELSAPVVLAAANWAQGRLSPLAPVQEEDVEASLLRLAAGGLGLDDDGATRQGIVDRIFELGGHVIEKEMAERLSSDLESILEAPGSYTPERTAAQLLATLPSPLARELQDRYGAGLDALLPAAGASAAELEAVLLERVPGELASALEHEYRDEVGRVLAEMTSWAADVLEHEINATLLQLLLASDELNRLTVDRGLKISDWSVRMAMDSFRRLDERSRGVVPAIVGATARQLAEEAAADEARLAARFQAYGRDRLAALTQGPSWPDRLTVEVPEASWLPLITLYGDGPLFGLIEKIGAAHPEGLALAIDFDPERIVGTSVERSESPRGVRIRLGRARDERDARRRLEAVQRQLLGS